ncbi:MAG: DUF2069 domain-containing protein [Gammaproteobacteria bacterium]|nr:DUF2069 domain-containing protein [Gammaproteobacteria bacterium]MCK5262705.1 DUF2069 domain-containing protein [Gammaproteobacteria bacterium]
MPISPILLSRWLTLTGYFGLMIGLYVWHLLINQTEAHLISIIILTQLGPLMFPLRGLLNGKIYTHAWSIYLAIFYFIVGIWYAGANETLMFGLYVTAFSLLFFTGTVLYTRLSSRNQKENTPD